MKSQPCEREPEVLQALQCGRWAGPWGEEIRKHAAQCAACSEVVLVAEMLRHENELAKAELRLPSAGLVWWKAQLMARRAAEERADQPIALAERGARVLGVLGVLTLGFWQWPRILSWLDGTKALARIPTNSIAETAHRVFQSFAEGFGQSPFYLLLVSAGAFLTLVAFAAYAVWREE